MKKVVILAATPKEIPGELTEIHEIPIVYTGVGKINAAATTVRVIRDLEPAIIINIGSCGSVTNIETGHLLKISEVRNDIETYPFATYGVTPFSNDGNIGLSHGNIRCLTADRFYDKYRTDYSKAYLDCLSQCHIVDMELYAIAQICNDYSVQCISYKWVSDTGTPNDWDNNKQIGFSKFEEKLYKLKATNEWKLVDALSDTERGTGGFGHTGKK